MTYFTRSLLYCTCITMSWHKHTGCILNLTTLLRQKIFNQMQNSINERLRILIEVLGTNPSALSKTLGISASTLRNYTDRDSKPGYEVLEKLYNSFKHINLHWLFGEAGPVLLSDVAEPGAIYQTQEKKRDSNTTARYARNGEPTPPEMTGELALAYVLIEQLQRQIADKERIIQMLENNKPTGEA